MAASDGDKGKRGPLSVKKCPECRTYLPLEVKKCTSCGSRVGPVDSHGMAKRPIDWGSYARCLLLWALLGVYLWWAFLKEKT
jgi:hypothetical protein